MTKLRRGLTWGLESEPACKQFVVSGGVAANQYIRTRLNDLATELGLELVCPPPKYCTDNGVMVAWAGVERSDLGGLHIMTKLALGHPPMFCT